MTIKELGCWFGFASVVALGFGGCYYMLKPDGCDGLVVDAGLGDVTGALSFLDQGVDINCHGGYLGETPLIAAASGGKAQMVKELLARRARVDAQSSSTESTALTQAIYAPHNIETVATLLDAGADVNRRGMGRPPLELALALKQFKIAQLLLEHGADVNSSSTTDDTPLTAAASAGDAQSVKLLLARHTAVNAETYGGKTALMLAASAGYIEVTKVLLQAGADVGLKDWQGETAADLADENKHRQVAELIRTDKR